MDNPVIRAMHVWLLLGGLACLAFPSWPVESNVSLQDYPDVGGYPGLLLRGVVWDISGSRVWFWGVGAQHSSYLVWFLVAVCFRVGRVVEQLAEHVGQRFLLDRMHCHVAYQCCFRETVVCSLGIMFRLPAVGLGDR